VDVSVFGIFSAAAGNSTIGRARHCFDYRTSGADTITAGNVSSILSGGDGDDTRGAARATTTIQAARHRYGGLFRHARAIPRRPIEQRPISNVDLRAGAPDGSDTLRDVENFTFSDGTFAAGAVLM